MNESDFLSMLRDLNKTKSDTVSIFTKKNGITYICIKTPGFTNRDLEVIYDPDTLTLQVTGSKNIAELVFAEVKETIFLRNDCKIASAMFDGMLIIELSEYKEKEKLRKIKIA